MHCCSARFPNVDEICWVMGLLFKALHTNYAQCSLVIFRNNARTTHLYIAAPIFPTCVSFICDVKADTGSEKGSVYFMESFGTVWRKYVRTSKRFYQYITLNAITPNVYCENDTTKTRRLFNYAHHASAHTQIRLGSLESR